MGGKKHKIDIVEIQNKSAKTVAFTKRRNGLFRKASELCRLSPNSQIAILATPLSSNSHASFYSFGHSSVDQVVSSVLQDQHPLSANQLQNRSGLGFNWWEDKGFDMSENVDELREAVDAVSRMLNNARVRLDDAVKSNQIDGRLMICNDETKTTTNQNHILEGESSGSASTLLVNEEDNLHFDDFFTDFNIDPLM
ncbi:PREDICTED: agamous-like MADS-box protein AGL97 [Camelina sativa]|uniref:Agamous-like MADS-box protein AGL97 n=1 Tax=Camelina sativa TaxID=90675 RepID=A0ABM0TUI5_CAMSA|nr:PREDICTED: agamous-like MADS-box protein AGL97 [Camelina sativa]